jgi:hypothetical protein
MLGTEEAQHTPLANDDRSTAKLQFDKRCNSSETSLRNISNIVIIWRSN